VLLTVLFWFGVIGAVREWRAAKKLGAPIARMERWYLAGGIVVAVAVSMIGDSMGLFDYLIGLFQTRTSFGFWLVVVLIVWTVRQMVRRTRLTPIDRVKARGL
jgi:hypothetical protein